MQISLEQQFAILTNTLRQFRHSVETKLEKMEKQMTVLDDAIAALQNDENVMQTQLNANSAVLTSISGSLQTAIANLAAGGVSAAQLAELQGLDAELQGQAAGLASADAAASTGGTSTTSTAAVVGADTVAAGVTAAQHGASEPVANAVAERAAKVPLGAGSAPTAKAGVDPHAGKPAPMPATAPVAPVAKT